MELPSFSRIVDLMSEKRDQKNIEKLVQNFRFFCFLLWPLYNTGDKIRSKGPYHVLTQAELQQETQRLQSFGAKSGASAAKSAHEPFVGLE